MSPMATATVFGVAILLVTAITVVVVIRGVMRIAKEDAAERKAGLIAAVREAVRAELQCDRPK